MLQRFTTKQLKMALDLAFDVSISYTMAGCQEMGMLFKETNYSTTEQRIFASKLVTNAIVYGVIADGVGDDNAG